MSKEEFEKYIKSIGFKPNAFYYVYKYYILYLYDDHYTFYIDSKLIARYDLNDLTPFKVFKKELRSNKLKQLLG